MSYLSDRQRGTTVIEVAFGSTVLLMMVLGIIDFGRMQFYRSSLQNAVSQSARFATIGGRLGDPSSDDATMTREASIYTLIKEYSGIDDIQYDDVSVKFVNASGRLVDGAGGSGDVVTVQATYRVRLVAPYLHPLFTSGAYEFTCTTSFKNEEFSGRPTNLGSARSTTGAPA